MDLLCHTKKEFIGLKNEKKDELVQWLNNDDGKSHKQNFHDDKSKKRKADYGKQGKGKLKNSRNGGNWKKNFKK